jgi:hypothetical protein
LAATARSLAGRFAGGSRVCSGLHHAFHARTPYMLTDFVVMTILLLWSRRTEPDQKDCPRRVALVFTPLLVAASAWIHGSWYMLVLPGAAILFAGYWRSAMAYGGCWLAGSFLGCALTGHPWEFLAQSVRHMFGVFGNSVVNRQLESEFYPSDGETSAVLLVIAICSGALCQQMQSLPKLCNPIFVMMVLGWVLGLKMRRFWWDYGIPAFMLWVAFELQDQLGGPHLHFDSVKRFLHHDCSGRRSFSALPAIATVAGQKISPPNF